MNEWGCRLDGGVGNLLTFVSLCDKNAGVGVICGAGYSPENTVALSVHHHPRVHTFTVTTHPSTTKGHTFQALEFYKFPPFFNCTLAYKI